MTPTEEFDKINCTQIGTFVKTHGIKGELVLKLNDLLPKKNNCIFIEINQLLIPFFFEKDTLKNYSTDCVIIKINDIDNEFQAREFLNNHVFIPKKKGKNTASDFVIEDLIDFKVEETEKGYIGVITGFIDIPKNPLLQIENNNKEILIPVNSIRNFHVDMENQTVTMSIPDGLLDI